MFVSARDSLTLSRSLALPIASSICGLAKNSLYLTYLFPAFLPMSASTRDSLTLSRSLDLPALPWAKTCAIFRILPPRSPDSLVRDPCGPARLLRIREDNLDIFGEPDVKKGRKGIWR